MLGYSWRPQREQADPTYTFPATTPVRGTEAESMSHSPYRQRCQCHLTSLNSASASETDTPGCRRSQLGDRGHTGPLLACNARWPRHRSRAAGLHDPNAACPLGSLSCADDERTAQPPSDIGPRPKLGKE